MHRFAVLTGRDLEVLHNERSYGGDFHAYCNARPQSLIAFTNANVAALKPGLAETGFHIIRDPRDIVVSAYFSHRNSHPIGEWKELEAHRETLRALNLEDGLNHEMEFCAAEFEDLVSWDYDTPNILELRYESLVENSYQHLLTAFVHLGLVQNDLPLGRVASASLLCLFNMALWKLNAARTLRWSRPSIPAELFLGLVHRLRFERLSGGRRQNQVNTQSHYRSGSAGSWARHFSARNVAHFKSLYADTLVQLGYETDDTW